MSYLALYRKYRPNTFDGLIGQSHIVKTLVNQIVNDKLGHAYLFTGTRGTGKTSTAKIFAKAINCLNPVNGSPCGNCECCLALNEPSNIDVIEIDAASNNGVNEIRELREKVQYPPVSCKYKVYIIDEVHMLTGPAFNALLKTLEEPPKHAVFILATTEVHKIPATILSRCMRFDFNLVSNQQISDLICKIYDEQGKKYELEAVKAIAKAGEGSIRDALSIADIALSYKNDILTYDDVMEILGSSNEQILLSLISEIINGNTGKVLQIIDKLCAQGKSVGVLIKDITTYVREIIVVKTCENAKELLALPLEKYNSLLEVANSVTEERCLRILGVFTETESMLKYSNNPRIIFESASIKASRPASDYDLDALLSRIKELEIKLEKGIKVQVESFSVLTKKESFVSDTVNAEQEQHIQHLKNKTERPTISSLSNSELKGRLLSNLRKNGNEMLWNVMQNVELKVVGNVLSIITFNTGDQELLDKTINREKIENAMIDFLPFELQIELSSNEKQLDELDKEAERFKKIFGDDIVIIK